MVFFTCNHCGESVKKPSVEKHYNQKCRGARKNVSCMDCQRDFRDEEYVAHTKCITELEKYSGKDYVHKESKNSGAKKQESWMEIVRSILDTAEYNLNAQVRAAFQRLQNVDNVPRKKAKFQNFTWSCMRMPKAQAEVVWNVLERELEKMKQAKQQQHMKSTKKVEQDIVKQAIENGTPTKSLENGDAEKKSKKRKDSAETNGTDVAEIPTKKVKKQKTENVSLIVEEQEITIDAENFDWNKSILKIVEKNEDGIVIENLKTKVLKKYVKKLGSTDELTAKQLKKFDKKFTKNLKKLPNVCVENDKVKIC